MKNFLLFCAVYFNLLQIIYSQKYEIDSIKICWTDNGDSTNVTMINKMNANNENNWFAFGLSCDQSMGDDDVAICQLNSDNTVSLFHYYNMPHIRPTLILNTNPTIGFSNIKTSYENDILSCSFTRQLNMPNVTHYFDLNNNKKYYILAAYGPIFSGLISYHSFREPSQIKYGFQNVSIKMNLFIIDYLI